MIKDLNINKEKIMKSSDYEFIKKVNSGFDRITNCFRGKQISQEAIENVKHHILNFLSAWRPKKT